MSSYNVEELTDKMRNVYNALSKPYLDEIEIVLEKVSPMFLNHSEEECINIAKKMLIARMMLK